MRTVRNIHQRIVPAPADTVGALLDRLSAPDDPLFPTPVWPAMVLDRPLGVGAADRRARATGRPPAFGRPDFTDAWRMPLEPGMDRDPHAWRHVLPFPVHGAADRELMLGKNASHLDFRSSVLVDDASVTLATAVRLHNTRGRLYFALARRVHPYLTRRMLRRAHRRVAFTAPPAGQRNTPAPADH
ncbi:DUF2867 domain-containing protein [Streptomyces sp. NPDC006703]|uniref:DUF2867 domain-containing protein n=1 Tax=Streptomyces sp. NPDC006703 TaxID=3364759 RepID=UPI0036AFDC05